MSDSLLLIVAGAVLVFWAVGAYNRLVRLRSQSLQAFGALDAQLRRHIGMAQTAAQGAFVQGGAQDAASPAAGLDAAASQCLASLAAARTKPLDADAMAALAAARGVLDMAWRRFTHEPGGAADAALPERLQVDWEHVVLQVHAAAQEFNQSVQQYNDAVQQFPALLLAWLFGFRTARPL
jgi:LemA protein